MVARFPSQPAPCCLCNSLRARIFRRARDRQNGNPGVFTYLRCRDCGLVRLDPMPTVDALARAYPDEYYSFQLEPGPGAAPASAAIGRKPVDPTQPFHSLPAARVLDVGCGTGAFLSAMRARGWSVAGVELSAAAATRGNQSLGNCIRAGDLASACFPDAAFDLVRLNHSFEHLPEPVAALREIRRVLRPGGLLFLGVPNIASAAARVFGRFWWSLSPGVHTFHYSQATLSKMLAQERFRVRRVTFRSDYAAITGSLRVLCNRARQGSVPSPRGRTRRGLTHAAQSAAQVVVLGLDRLHCGDAIELLAERPPS